MAEGLLDPLSGPDDGRWTMDDGEDLRVGARGRTRER